MPGYRVDKDRIAMWGISIVVIYSSVYMARAQDSNDTHTSSTGRSARTESAEKRLLQDLLGGYERVGRNARPVLNTSHPVSVLFGLGLIQMELNEKENILSMSMWTRYRWRDEYLQWEPHLYNGVTSTRLRSDQIWKPDIMLYNTANVEVEARDALATVSPDGTVSWFPHCIFRSACAVDVKNYPFDIQQCHLWFGSWTYPSKEVDLDMAFPGGIDLTTFQADYKESSKWEVANVTAIRRQLPTPDEDPNFAVLTFTLHLRRRMVFSTYMLTLPCVALACLTLVVFWLPPERPDRTALAMNAFASFMVLLLILVEAAMPTASSVPRLGMYYCFNLVIIMLAIFLSSVVINIAKGRGGRPVPPWMYFTTIHISSPCFFWGQLGMDISDIKRYRASQKQADPDSSRHPGCCFQRRKTHHAEMGNISHRAILYNYADGTEGKPQAHQNNMATTPGAGNNTNTMEEVQVQLLEIRKTMNRIETTMEKTVSQKHEAGMIAREWRVVGGILDRWFFILYIFLIALSLLVFFPKPGPEYELWNTNE